MATGYLYEGTVIRVSRIVVEGSTVFYIMIDNQDKPVRLLPSNLKPSELAKLVFTQVGDQISVRCDWANKDDGYLEAISFQFS